MGGQFGRFNLPDCATTCKSRPAFIPEVVCFKENLTGLLSYCTQIFSFISLCFAVQGWHLIVLVVCVLINLSTCANWLKVCAQDKEEANRETR